MKNYAVRIGLLTLALALVFGGCIDNDKSLVIVGAAAPDDKCEYKIDPEVWQAAGLLDTATASGYVAFLQVENFLVNNADDIQLDSMAI